MFKTAFLTLLAMLAFAGNSVLSRAALANGEMDWASFTAIRLVSGAIMLALLLGYRHRAAIIPRKSDMGGIFTLFGYAVLFSLAYVDLTAATGALVLFASVQITIQTVGLFKGDRPSVLQWAGMALAFAGLGWLLMPGLSAPPLFASFIMAGAGISWGLYSWFGRGAKSASVATARNFIGAAPLALLLVFWIPEVPGSKGILLAVTSGAITSALGYVIWYVILPRLSVITSGVVQLSVPAIAALGGVLFLSESISLRLVVATSLIFLGIALTLRAKTK